MCRRHPHPSTSRPPLPIPPKHRETSPVLDGAGMRRTAGDQTCLREPDALGTAFPIVSAQDAHLHIEAHCSYQHYEPVPRTSSSMKNAGADPRPLDLSASRPMALATHSPDEDYDCSPADLAQARLVYTEHPSVTCIDVPHQVAQNRWLAMECEEEIMQILVPVPSAAGEGHAGAAMHVTRSRTRINPSVQAGEARLDKSSQVSKSMAKSESL